MWYCKDVKSLSVDPYAQKPHFPPYTGISQHNQPLGIAIKGFFFPPLSNNQFLPKSALSFPNFHKKKKHMNIHRSSDVVSWLKDRSSSDLRSHLLYLSDGAALGASTELVKQGVQHFGLRLGTEVVEISSRLVSNNELSKGNVVAMYEADVPDVDFNSPDVEGHKVLLLVTPSDGKPIKAVVPDSLRTILSIYNPNAEQSERNILALLAVCATLSSQNAKIVPESPSTQTTQSTRPEAVVCKGGSILPEGLQIFQAKNDPKPISPGPNHPWVSNDPRSLPDEWRRE